MILELKIKKDKDDPSFYTIKRITEYGDQCVISEWWQLKKNGLNWETITLVDNILSKEEQENIIGMKLCTSDDNKIYSYLKNLKYIDKK